MNYPLFSTLLSGANNGERIPSHGYNELMQAHQLVNNFPVDQRFGLRCQPMGMMQMGTPGQLYQSLGQIPGMKGFGVDTGAEQLRSFLPQPDIGSKGRLSSTLTSTVSPVNVLAGKKRRTIQGLYSVKQENSMGQVSVGGSYGVESAEEKLRRRRYQIALASRKSRAKRRLELGELKDENKRLKQENAHLRSEQETALGASNDDQMKASEQVSEKDVLGDLSTSVSKCIEELRMIAVEEDNAVSESREKLTKILETALSELNVLKPLVDSKCS